MEADVLMRIISGKYKGRIIEGYDIDGTRPTQDRIKESMFAMIQEDIYDSICLDLFSGTGNLGIEALSNGASKCYFVDNNRECIKVINDNINTFDISDKSVVVKDDYGKSLGYFRDSGIKFDLILVDPPYEYKVINEVMDKVNEYDLLNDGGIIVLEYRLDDFEALFEILSDAETMQHYPKPYDEEMTKHWIEWNIQNYKEYGFGIWAVELKETGTFIGDCGMTIQNIDGELLPEIGYHIHKKYWRKGFGSEAAKAVRDWAFENTKYDCLYSYMKYTNIGSFSTAIANGMKKVKEYPDPKNTISYAYAITREEWQKMRGE